MALNTEERFNLLQQYHENTNYNIRQSIVHKFVRDAFPSDDECNQISNYIKVQQMIKSTMEKLNTEINQICYMLDNRIIDIIKYF